MKTNKNISLVADIGGTNARLALVEGTGPELLETRNLACAEYPSIVDAIEDYFAQVDFDRPAQAAISIATPVAGDSLAMTNHSWRFSVRETRQALGLDSLKILNDYTALALALPFLPEDECTQIGQGEKSNDHPKAAIGPGTGLGVSGLISTGAHWYPLESEGGHVSYGPLNQREAEIISVLRNRMKHISVESLVSGPGIALLYEVITGLETGEARRLRPSEITELANSKGCPMAIEALSIFCAILGTVAGNLALTLGARGGVYLGGGILGRISEIFTVSDFRERFEQHGRLTDYLKRVPTYLIESKYPALTGAMVSLNKEYNSVGQVSLTSS